MNTVTISRRDFIKIATVAGGGLMLGFRIPSESNSADFSPNVWLRIAPDDTVTITVARSEMGQGVWTSLPMIVAEELDADWNHVRIEQADAHPVKFGSQSTGGSFSVRGSWQTLRMAGATARDMLVTAAAKKWNVAKVNCTAAQSFVRGPGGRKLSYGELASDAAELPVPHSVRLKEEKAFTLIGTRVRKLDTPSKVRGTAIFGLDVRLPGMMFASIQKCPVFGGTVASFDASAAKKVPGVVDVFQVEDGLAVVATNTWAAFQGREALQVTWNEGKWANQSSAAIRKTFESALANRGTVDNYAGNAETALASSSVTVEAVYEAPFVAHQTMEPMNCTAWVRRDSCEIWAPTQSPQPIQNQAAQILGLPLDRVTVHVTLMGGGFGRRLNPDFGIDAVRVAKAMKGTPVQVVWTREDDTQHDWYRPMTLNILKAGLGKDGRPVAWMHRIAGPSSRGLVTGGSTPPYDIPNFVVESHILETGVPIGAWRSVGPSQNAWIVESFIDELALKAGKDPLEYRRSLLSKSPRLKRTLEVAAEKAAWGTPLPKGKGRGIACVDSFGSTCAQVAEVSVANGKVKIDRIVVAVDCGTAVNPDTIEAQIEGAIAYGLSAALKDEITIDKGRVQQESYDDYRMLQFDEMPRVEVHIIPSTEPVGGIGEPGLPPVAPALCNAIFMATGRRIRKLPFGLG
ncbi:MAG: aldehyde oxidase [Bacteroidia bacterium]|nr:MAG: aldehyde oxidase [Bacteroidia bacterium]